MKNSPLKQKNATKAPRTTYRNKYLIANNNGRSPPAVESKSALVEPLCQKKLRIDATPPKNAAAPNLPDTKIEPTIVPADTTAPIMNNILR